MPQAIGASSDTSQPIPRAADHDATAAIIGSGPQQAIRTLVPGLE